MQNIKGITVNEGTALRELSLDETEMVGGGFSWGGLLHGAEHVAAKVGSEVGNAVITAASSAATSAIVTAKFLKKEVAKLPKEEPTGPAEPNPFGDPVDFPWFG
jgi:hypothetical protein